jgi:ParB-like chromosome segregation protein Spo0J
MSLPGVLDPWREVIHPAALILPRPSEREYADLKASIAERGILTPVATFIDGKGEHWLLDGVSRLQALVELDQPILDNEGRWAIPTTPYSAEHGHDPYEIALSLNVVRRHLTNEQKREVIRQLREERPELSDRAIARMAGVSPHTVAEERQAAEDEGFDPETGEVVTNGELPVGDDGEDTQENVTPISRGVVREREEVTGRRARGRQAKTPVQRRERRQQPAAEPVQEQGQPFVGTVLATASKTQRIAEAKRCLKFLGLTIADLAPKRRAA